MNWDGVNANKGVPPAQVTGIPEELLARLQLPLYIADENGLPDIRELALIYNEDGLTLTDGKLSMQGDFSEKMSRLKENNLRGELLVKAAKIKNAADTKNANQPLTLLDATAGMGEDSLILAAAGFAVDLYEYDPVIAALLSDTLRRAAQVPELAPIAARMHLHPRSSIEAMRELTEAPDVILLDPMFPERQKSGLIKKKFQLLQQLEQPCTDENELLEAAIALKPRKIVIKRPAKGPYLGGRKPDYSLNGKAIRYDILINL